MVSLGFPGAACTVPEADNTQLLDDCSMFKGAKDLLLAESASLEWVG